MDIDFLQKFINIDFDKLVKEEILKDDEYQNFKKDYFKETNENFNKYKMFNNELNILSNTQSINTKDKFLYVYIDENQKSLLIQQIKNIVLSQTKLLENFQHYITILNTNIIYLKPKQKSFLSKLNFFEKV